MELNELRKIAEAATPGPWITRLLMATQKTAVHSVDDLGKYSTPVVTRGISAENAKHIAAFDPPTVLALLSRLEQAEQDVQRVRAMAQDWESNGNSCAVGDRSADVWHATANAIRRTLDGDPRADV